MYAALAELVCVQNTTNHMLVSLLSTARLTIKSLLSINLFIINLDFLSFYKMIYVQCPLDYMILAKSSLAKKNRILSFGVLCGFVSLLYLYVQTTFYYCDVYPVIS